MILCILLALVIMYLALIITIAEGIAASIAEILLTVGGIALAIWIIKVIIGLVRG